jgi:hypothetical protein
LLISGAWVVIVNTLLSLLYLGPIEHLHQMIESIKMLGEIYVNTPEAMGASGRVDLTPLLATFGLRNPAITLIQLLLLLQGCALLFLSSKKINRNITVILINVLVALTIYHRDYDLIIILILVIPILYKHWQKLRPWYFLIFLPSIIPITAMYQFGNAKWPSLIFLWNLIGSSMCIATGFLGGLVYFWEKDNRGNSRITLSNDN